MTIRVLERNRGRADRAFGDGPIRRQTAQLRKSLRGLGREGFRTVHVLSSPAEVDEASIVRDRLLNDFRDQHGPFDIIGDVHGCLDELLELLGRLGYTVQLDSAGRAVDAVHPDGRRVVFVGDLVSFYADIVKTGRTSITVSVEVYAQRMRHANEIVKVTEATLTYVATDESRQPRVLPAA